MNRLLSFLYISSQSNLNRDEFLSIEISIYKEIYSTLKKDKIE